jgi:hypothetical protein
MSIWAYSRPDLARQTVDRQGNAMRHKFGHMMSTHPMCSGVVNAGLRRAS